MKVKSPVVGVLALGAALVVVGLFTASPAQAAPPQKLDRAVGLKLQAAQKDAQKGDYAAALAALDEAAAMPKQTPYSRHIATQLYVYAYEKTHNYAKLAPKLEALSSDEYATPAERDQFTTALAQIYYELHNYPKAIQYGNEAIQKGLGGSQMPTLVGQAYYLSSNWRGTIQFERNLIAKAVRSGQKPSKQSLQLVQSSCQHLNDNDCLMNSIEQLVVYYPEQSYWQYLVYKAMQSVKSDANLLQIYRLAFNVGVMQQPHEFSDYAELAVEANDPGEAEQVLNKALAANVFTDAQAKAKAERILKDAKRKSNQDLAGGLDATAAAAARQSSGQSDANVGLAYFGYQQYDKAVAEYTHALAKGGLKDAAETHLMLGISQLKAGNKAAALKAFNAVQGNATLKRLASLWSLQARSAS